MSDTFEKHGSEETSVKEKKKQKGKIYLDFPSAETVIEKLAKHPYLWALGICLFIHLIFLSDIRVYITSYSLFAQIITLTLAGSLVLFILHDKKKIGFISYIGLELLYIAAVIGFMYGYSDSTKKPYWVCCFFAVLSVGLYAYFRKTLKKKEYMEKLNSLLIMALGFSVKVAYSLTTTEVDRQHDWFAVLTFDNVSVDYEGGHKGYIQYLMSNHCLPNDTDIRYIWQFYHPPLFHMISAIWVSINKFFLQFIHGEPIVEDGIVENHAFCSVKIISLFAVMCIIISTYKILRHFKLSGKALYIPMVLMNFHSAYIFFSGALNNDPLSVAFIMGALLCTLKWYEDRTLKNILKIALCIGLGMMTKMSAALVAPPVALIFLIALIKYRKEEFKKLFGQFAVFGAVCIPLGLWFGIRNYIKWGVPLNYVQEYPRPFDQWTLYINKGTWERFTDFSLYQLKSVYFQTVFDSYNEFNPLIALLKTAIFGEDICSTTFKKGSYWNYFGTFQFWLHFAIALIAFVFMILCVIKWKKIKAKTEDRLLMLSFYVVLIVSYYDFSIKYPFTFTMHYRYVTPLGVIGAIFLALYIVYIRDKWADSEKGVRASKAITNTIWVMALVFAAVMSLLCLLLIVGTKAKA